MTLISCKLILITKNRETNQVSVVELKKEISAISRFFETGVEVVKDCMKGCDPKKFIINTFPVFTWLRAYKKTYFVGDMLSGFTVAVMHIPQGFFFSSTSKIFQLNLNKIFF